MKENQIQRKMKGRGEAMAAVVVVMHLMEGGPNVAECTFQDHPSESMDGYP